MIAEDRNYGEGQDRRPAGDSSAASLLSLLGLLPTNLLRTHSSIRRAPRPPNAPTERGVAFDRAGRGRGGRSQIGYCLFALDGSVAKNILATFHSSNDQMLTAISCMISELLQQSPK